MSNEELIFRMLLLQWRVTSLRCWWCLELLRRRLHSLLGVLHASPYRWMVLLLVLCLGSVDSTRGFAQSPMRTCQANAATTVIVSIAVSDGANIVRQGSGIIMRTDGLILTSYQLVRGAPQIQLRFGDGTVFNRAVLVAFDEARDLAAIRIQGRQFSMLPVADQQITANESIFVLGRSPDGMISAAPGTVVFVPPQSDHFRIAAPVEKGTLGSSVLDCDGRLLGLIVTSGTNGPETEVLTVNSVLRMTTVSGEVLGSGESISYPGASATRQEVHNAHTEKVSAQSRTFALRSNTVLIPDDLMLEALRNQHGFSALDLVLVDNPSVADVMIEVAYVPFTFDYTFKAWERRTSVVIASGKITAFNGYLAAPELAAKLVSQLVPSHPVVRSAP